MGHSQLNLNHGLKYFSERDLAMGIIFTILYLHGYFQPLKLLQKMTVITWVTQGESRLVLK